MKNVRKEGEYLVYDCESKACQTPGRKHKIKVNVVMAALEVAYQEFSYHEDPRAEGLDIALQFLYQELAGEGGESFPTDPLPWAKQVASIKKYMMAQAAEDDRPSMCDAAPASRKEMLN